MGVCVCTYKYIKTYVYIMYIHKIMIVGNDYKNEWTWLKLQHSHTPKYH